MPKKLYFHRVISWLSDFNIARKIGCGYSLAIGIAVLGTTVGLIAGDYYQRKAQKQLLQVSRQHNLFDELEQTLLTIRSHPQELIAVLEDSIWFQYETSQFTSDADRAKVLLSKLGALARQQPNSLATDPQTLQSLLQQQRKTLDAYIRFIEALHQQIDPLELTADRLPEARRQVLNAIAGPEAIRLRLEFERFSESLTRIARDTQRQYVRANEQLVYANTLRLKIILCSMILSAAIAAVLAFFTSRAIAHPLEAVTQVAQRAIQEENFDLQVAATSRDEIGTLATALNQLIQWVGDYTARLEEARKNLEQRVEERTAELTRALHDLQMTQTQLIQTEKMSSLGQMVAGIAHELNNPVNFIHGNIIYTEQYCQNLMELIELYQKHCCQVSPEIQEYREQADLEFVFSDLPSILKSMKVGTERIKDIVISLRNFSRLDESEQKSVDIHEGIENSLLILSHRIKNNIQVIKKYDELPLIACYPAQLNQVFMNIIANALDALLDSEVNPKQLIVKTANLEKDRIQVSIKDNGSGISPEIRDRLFDPFFTTKPVGKGTGLGLSICYQIVEKHQGKIEVISELGRGSEFRIALPIQPEPSQRDRAGILIKPAS